MTNECDNTLCNDGTGKRQAAVIRIDTDLLCEECAADPSAVVSDSPEEVDDLHRSRYAPGVTVAPPPETKRERGVRFYRRGWWDYTHTLYRPQTNDKELWSDYNAGWSASMQANAAMRAVGAR